MELVSDCARKKKYRGTKFTLDYKTNFHAGLEPP
jgi:hypothetical protein